MEKNADAMVMESVTVLDEMLGYSQASLEYSGLVLYSYLKRGGMTVIDPLEKMASPVFGKVGTIVGRTFQGVLSGMKKIFSLGASTKTAEQLDAIDRRLTEIEAALTAFDNFEKRLAYLEKHGIIATREGGLQVKGKKLTEDRLMLLQTIVKENIDLMRSEG